jgi:hypothetical protein
MAKPLIKTLPAVLSTIASALICLGAHAEGLPISKNHLNCKKLTITLTKAQLQRAKAGTRISLTPAQSALFLKQVKYVPKSFM